MEDNYYEIVHLDYLSKRVNTRIEIGPKELIVINKAIKKTHIESNVYNDDLFYKFESNALSSIMPVMIFKIPDDWYFLYYLENMSSSTFKSYKCDQLDGLVKLLEDIL